MIRLRVSTLEAFRRVVETDFGDEPELIDRVRRGQWEEGTASEIMRAGTAWHKIIAEPIRFQQIGFEPVPFGGNPVPYTYFACNGFTFDDIAVEAATKHVGPGLHEVTRRKLFGAVEIEGTADLVCGLSLQDHKAKFSQPDARDYEDSLQWRFYLAIHEASWFRYNLFDFKDPKEGYCELKQIVSFRFWPYLGMEAELRGWITRFLDWAEARGLAHFLHYRRAA